MVGPDARLIAIPITIAGYDRDTVLVNGAFQLGARVVVTRLTDGGPGLLVDPRP